MSICECKVFIFLERDQPSTEAIRELHPRQSFPEITGLQIFCHGWICDTFTFSILIMVSIWGHYELNIYNLIHLFGGQSLTKSLF